MIKFRFFSHNQYKWIASTIAKIFFVFILQVSVFMQTCIYVASIKTIICLDTTRKLDFNYGIGDQVIGELLKHETYKHAITFSKSRPEEERSKRNELQTN